MRWTLVFLVLFLPLVVAAEPWGCCVPDALECYDSEGFSEEQTFIDACTNDNGIIKDAGLAETCDAYAECTLGCCCAGPGVSDSPNINRTESLLYMTQNQCDLKDGDYYFNALPDGSTCVQVCGGEETPDTGETYTVSGTVVNASDGNGLADATAFIAFSDGDISALTAADGTFTLEGVPNMQSSVFAVHASCQPGQSEVLLFDQDITDVVIELSCESESCLHEVPAFLEYPVSVPGTDDVAFTMDLADVCGDFLQYETQACDDQWQNCVSLEPTTSPAITATGLAPGTTYCFTVDARFSDGTTTTTGQDSQACITTGDPECLGREEDDPSEWCGVVDSEHAILSCDENNHLESQLCGTLMCSDRSGSPECVPMPPCDTCNGLLGLFSHLGFEVSPDGLTVDLCENVCLLDSVMNGNPLMLDAYQACFAVADCTNYDSRAACEADFCDVSEQCEWITISEELGQGLCVSPDKPACDECNDLFGYCNKDTCEAISPECYFDGETNGLTYTLGCLHKDDMACRYYDTQEDCGTVNAEYDIHYTNGERSGGSNARTLDSDDLLGIGACSWSGSICFKDADMQNEGEDDCIENGRIYTDGDCLADSLPPETSFFLSDPPVYERVGLRTLPKSVIDNWAATDDLETFVCFDSDGSCYPQQTLAQIELPEAGEYIMSYYSIDPSENSEKVENVAITVQDSGIPGIKEVTIEEDQ